ncbi:MAG: TRAP transporter large permease [Lachnospiraceae bacterium]|nr:TRAP transporter large permease [Lachnospiraceae bacterium]
MEMKLILFIIAFVLVFLLRLPMGPGMLAACVVYILASGGNLTVIANQVCTTYWTNYTIIAIPLFIFTANVMNNGKASELLFKWCDTIFGRFKGGMAYVNCVISLIFAGMSGSAVADASGIGLMEMKEMRRQGYDEDFAAALTGATATVGPVFPPSITMLMYASVTGASVGKLFIAGVIPGIMMCVSLMVYVFYYGRVHGLPVGVKYTLKMFLRITFQAFPALLCPVILLVSIYGGICTPTEAGAIAGFYALVISLIVYRCLGWKELKSIFVATAQMVGRIAITVGCASAIVYIAGLEKLPVYIGGWLLGLTDNKYLFLLIINLGFLLMGMVFDTNTITLIFLPMVLGTVQALHIDLIHFGVIFVVNMMIGLLTPPFGNLLFTTSAITSAPMNKLIKRLIPMIGVLFVCLLLLTYIPQFSTFLPSMMLGK